MARILLATLGSHGDLNPFLAAGIALQNAGHEVRFATQAEYEAKVQRAGLVYLRLRPSEADFCHDPGLMAEVTDPRKGGEAVFRKILMPWLRQTCEDLLAASHGCELIVGHWLLFGVPMVAELRGIPWISALLQASPILSSYDPPLLPGLEWVYRMKAWGRWPHQALFWIARWRMESWLSPVKALRKELKLMPRSRGSFAWDSKASPYLNLGFFDPSFFPPQPDWPKPFQVTGFPYYDEDGSGELSAECEAFLAQGNAPIVFTLGSSAVKSARSFFERAYHAMEERRARGIFLVGSDNEDFATRARQNPKACVTRYEPFSKLFPRASLIVHSAGIGTTAQALRSGIPQLCVPFANDQPDNAARVQRMGLGRSIEIEKLTSSALLTNMNEIFSDKSFASRAAAYAGRVDPTAFDRNFVTAIEHVLKSKPI